jgi:hypothetical protein
MFSSLIGWLLILVLLVIALKRMKSFWRDILSV